MSPEVIADLTNGLFELGGAAVISLNFYRLGIDRCVKGIHWGSVVFFTSWGLWNLYFYPSLNQWISFSGGVALALANACWLVRLARIWLEDNQDGEEE